MPIYEFTCDNCQNKFEKIKKISEGNLTESCSECGLFVSRNRNPSRVSVICRSLKNDANEKNDANDRLVSSKSLPSNKISSPSVIKLVNVKNARLDNIYFENVGTAISAENVKMLTGENTTFKNVQNPIEHKNSEIDLKNVSYEKS